MYGSRLFLRKLVTLPISVIALLSSSAIAAATEKGVHVPDSARVTKVEVVLTPKNIQTRFPWREEDLYSSGCVFTVAGNQAKLDELIKILRNKLSVSSDVKEEFALRNAVYLYSNDGTKSTFLFSDSNNPTKSVYGLFHSAEGASSSAITGNESLLDAFRAWASSDVSRVNRLKFCLQN